MGAKIKDGDLPLFPPVEKEHIKIYTFDVPDNFSPEDYRLLVDQSWTKAELELLLNPLMRGYRIGRADFRITKKGVADKTLTSSFLTAIERVALKKFSTKAVYVEIALWFVWNVDSVFTLFRNTTDIERDLLLKMGECWALSEDSIAKQFGKTSSRRSYYSYDKPDWLNDSCTLLYLFSKKVRSDYYSPYYWIPTKMLQEIIFRLKHGVSPETIKLTISDNPDIPENASVITTDDITDCIASLVNLRQAGQLPMGKTKVGISAMRKLKETISLHDFTASCPERGEDRYRIVAELAARAISDEPGKSLDTPLQRFWIDMAESLFRDYLDYLILFFPASCGVTTNFLVETKKYLSLFFEMIEGLLKSSASFRSGGWLDFTVTRDIITTNCINQYGRIFSPLSAEYQSVDRIKDPDKKHLPLSVSRYMRDFHYASIRQIVYLYAAIGMVDFVTDNDPEDPEILFVRLNRCGRYFYNIDNDIEIANSLQDPHEIFSLEDHSLTVSVKNPDSPFVNTLKEMSVRLTEKRYRLSQEQILENYPSTEELEAARDQFVNIICAEPGPRTRDFFDTLIRKSNALKKVSLSKYRMFEIGKDDIQLQRLLMEDSLLRSLTVRVEGFRVLVHESNYDKIKKLLFHNGYLLP